MYHVPIVTFSVALVLLALALVREVRLRRALQALVARLLAQLRRDTSKEDTATGGDRVGRLR